MSNLSEVSKLVLTAAISSLVSVTLYKNYEKRTQKIQEQSSSSSSPSTKDSSADSDGKSKELSQEEEVLIKEQLSRGIIFFGEDKVEKIRKSFVIVVGLGGVGSHAATMLVRNGVERIRLIDFDQVTLSSLNRHANATRLDVGKSKASVLKDHLLKICPHVEIETREAIFSESNAEELLAGNPDYVLDCIDNITTKAFLLKYCKEKDMKVICSMGAGAKCDPSRLLIADISHTSADPLSRAIRKMLKKFGIDKGIPTVFSCEIPTIGLVPLPEEQAREAESYQVIPEFRIRILPVLGPLPATFGNAMAAYVLQHLAGTELKQLPIKGRSEFNKKAFHQYQMRERDIRKIAPETIPFTPEDVDYVIEEIWRNKSGISGAIEHLVLTIWDRSRPAGTDNCILMTMKELAKHDKLTSLSEGYPPEVINRIEAVFEEERQLNKVRTLYKFT